MIRNEHLFIKFKFFYATNINIINKNSYVFKSDRKKEKRNDNETRVLNTTNNSTAHIVPAKGYKKNKIKENYQ